MAVPSQPAEGEIAIKTEPAADGLTAPAATSTNTAEAAATATTSAGEAGDMAFVSTALLLVRMLLDSPLGDKLRSDPSFADAVAAFDSAMSLLPAAAPSTAATSTLASFVAAAELTPSGMPRGGGAELEPRPLTSRFEQATACAAALAPAPALLSDGALAGDG